MHHLLMDFWVNDDEQAVRDGIRAFLGGRLPLSPTVAGDAGASTRRRAPAVVSWQELGELGVFSLRRDGLGAREAVLVFEELGRSLVPGPLVSTHLAAGLVDGAAEGRTMVGLLEPQPLATLVEHAHQVDCLLRFVDGDLVVVDPASLEWEDVERPLDPFSSVRCCVTPIGRLRGDILLSGARARATRQRGVVLTAALQLGVAGAALDLANAYAKERQQFGRPIGSFQAVKHLLAEMLVKFEVARAAVYAAACAIDGMGDGDIERAVSVAKVTAGEAALFNGKTGIQVHGGMGFTWEVNAQRYWKRAVVLDATFGGADSHAALIANALPRS